MSAVEKKYWILLADESEDDRFFTRRVLASCPECAVCHETGDGEELISYLEGENGFADRAGHPFPDLILLDLKLNKMSGYQVLEWLKSSRFFAVPIFVVSGSDFERDRMRCLSLGAVVFCLKPAGSQDEGDLVGHIDRWIRDSFLEHKTNR